MSISHGDSTQGDGAWTTKRKLAVVVTLLDLSRKDPVGVPCEAWMKPVALPSSLSRLAGGQDVKDLAR